MESKINQLMQISAEYACFNSRRSLSCIDQGSPRWYQNAEDILILDLDSPENTYVNRLCTTADRFHSARKEHPSIKRIYVFSVGKPAESPPETKGFKPSYVSGYYSHSLKQSPELPNFNSKISVELCKNPDRFFAEVSRSIEEEFETDILRAKKSLYCSDQFKCYLALIDKKVVGMATIFISGGMGWFANAFTHCDYRSIGVQSALLNIRVKDSMGLGLSSVFTEVDLGSQSERNVLRNGFEYVASSVVLRALD